MLLDLIKEQQLPSNSSRLPTPEEEINDLCGRLDKSLKLAQEVIDDNKSVTMQIDQSNELSDTDGSFHDEVILKAPKKLSADVERSFVIGNGTQQCMFMLSRNILSMSSTVFDIRLTTKEVYRSIIEDITFKDSYAFISGKNVRQPSQMAWLGTNRYPYRGIHFEAANLASFPMLLSLTNLMNNSLSTRPGHKEYNSIFVHLLEECTDHIEWSISESDMFEGDQTILVLGANERTLQLAQMEKGKKKGKPSSKSVISTLHLADGTTVTMNPDYHTKVSCRISRIKAKLPSKCLILFFRHEKPSAHVEEQVPPKSESEMGDRPQPQTRPTVPPRPDASTLKNLQ